MIEQNSKLQHAEIYNTNYPSLNRVRENFLDLLHAENSLIFEEDISLHSPNIFSSTRIELNQNSLCLIGNVSELSLQEVFSIPSNSQEVFSIPSNSEEPFIDLENELEIEFQIEKAQSEEPKDVIDLVNVTYTTC